MTITSTTYILVLIAYGAFGDSPTLAPIHDYLYDATTCKVAGDAWVADGSRRKYFCIPSPALKVLPKDYNGSSTLLK